MNCGHLQQVIDAWLDGELDGGTNAQALAHAATCQRCSALRDSRERLRSALRVVTPYEAPAHLRRSIRTAMKGIESENEGPRPRVRIPLWPAATALAAASAFAFVIGWQLRSATPAPEPFEPIVALHVASMSQRDGLVQVASSDRHTVKPWFAGKLPFSPPVRDLRADGFSLVGGRIDDLNGQRGAALVYRIREHVVTLFITASNAGSQPVTVSSLRGFAMAAWRADGLTLTAVSDVNPADLQRFVQLVRSP